MGSNIDTVQTLPYEPEEPAFSCYDTVVIEDDDDDDTPAMAEKAEEPNRLHGFKWYKMFSFNMFKWKKYCRYSLINGFPIPIAATLTGEDAAHSIGYQL